MIIQVNNGQANRPTNTANYIYYFCCCLFLGSPLGLTHHGDGDNSHQKQITESNTPNTATRNHVMLSDIYFDNQRFLQHKTPSSRYSDIYQVTGDKIPSHFNANNGFANSITESGCSTLSKGPKVFFFNDDNTHSPTTNTSKAELDVWKSHWQDYQGKKCSAASHYLSEKQVFGCLNSLNNNNGDSIEPAPSVKQYIFHEKHAYSSWPEKEKFKDYQITCGARYEITPAMMGVTDLRQVNRLIWKIRRATPDVQKKLDYSGSHSIGVVEYQEGSKTIPTLYRITNAGFVQSLDINNKFENFSFIPQSLLPELAKYHLNPVQPSYFQSARNGHITIEELDNKIIMVVDVGQRGTAHFVYDITQRLSPKYMYKIEASADYPHLGYTWSTPTFTKLEGYINSQGNSKVMVVAAGHHPEHPAWGIQWDKQQTIKQCVKNAPSADNVFYVSPEDALDSFSANKRKNESICLQKQKAILNVSTDNTTQLKNQCLTVSASPPSDEWSQHQDVKQCMDTNVELIFLHGMVFGLKIIDPKRWFDRRAEVHIDCIQKIRSPHLRKMCNYQIGSTVYLLDPYSGNKVAEFSQSAPDSVNFQESWFRPFVSTPIIVENNAKDDNEPYSKWLYVSDISGKVFRGDMSNLAKGDTQVLTWLNPTMENNNPDIRFNISPSLVWSAADFSDEKYKLILASGELSTICQNDTTQEIFSITDAPKQTTQSTNVTSITLTQIPKALSGEYAWWRLKMSQYEHTLDTPMVAGNKILLTTTKATGRHAACSDKLSYKNYQFDLRELFNKKLNFVSSDSDQYPALANTSRATSQIMLNVKNSQLERLSNTFQTLVDNEK